MREIITVQVGQAGNNIGHQTWNQLLNEHNLDQNGYFMTCDDQVCYDKYIINILKVILLVYR